MTTDQTPAPPIEYRATPDGGVDLHLDGQPPRMILRPMRPKRVASTFAAELNRALGLGAAHGPCDERRELADDLLGRQTPGHVLYVLRRPDRTLTALCEGRDEPVPLPTVRPLSRRCELANALDDAFRLGGQIGRADPIRDPVDIDVDNHP